MDSQALKAELRRPAYLMAAVALALLALAVWLVLAGLVYPAQEKARNLQHQLEGITAEIALRQNLEPVAEQAATLGAALPALRAKLAWRGSSGDFSRAVLDAATLTGIGLDREINDVRVGSGHRIYVKTVYFQSGYEGFERFLATLQNLDMLVVPVSVAIAEQADHPDLLAVTLTLNGYSEQQP